MRYSRSEEWREENESSVDVGIVLTGEDEVEGERFYL